jgi:hypothetical protein
MAEENQETQDSRSADKHQTPDPLKFKTSLDKPDPETYNERSIVHITTSFPITECSYFVFIRHVTTRCSVNHTTTEPISQTNPVFLHHIFLENFPDMWAG